MDIDLTIRQAMENTGRALTGNDLWMVEGNPVTGQMKVNRVDTIMHRNLLNFIYERDCPFLCLGIFTTQTTAEEAMDAMRTLFRKE